MDNINLNSMFAGRNTFIVNLEGNYLELKDKDFLVCEVGISPSSFENAPTTHQFVVKMLSRINWCVESYRPEKPLKNGLERPKTDFCDYMEVHRDMVAYIIFMFRKYL